MANTLKNIFITYIDRSYQQIKDRLLNKMASKTPEITDKTDTNIFVKILSIWAGITEMIGYYIDNMANESYISTCRLYSSAVKIAEQYDYNIKSKSPASVDLTFYTDIPTTSNIIIPQNTKIVHNTDPTIVFYTTESVTLLINTSEIVVSAIQQELITDFEVGNSDGTNNQKFELPTDIVNGSISLKVENDTWEYVESLGRSKYYELHFTTSINENQIPILKFGDDYFGKIPDNGGLITISYQKTLGTKGNVEIETLTIIDSIITVPNGVNLFVTNKQKASGGSEIESLEEIKRFLPLSNRTLRTAYSKQDYIDIAKLAAGVSQAEVLYNCGKNIYIYIVPTGGGLASEFLCQSVVAYFEDKKTFGVTVSVLPAGELTIYIKLKIYAKKNYINSTIKTNVENALLSFYSTENQNIKDSIYISDIYEIIESVEGVKNSIIEKMSILPYARCINDFIPLNWTNTILATGNEIVYWLLSFTSNTTYQLYKNNNFKGTFNVDDVIQQTEIQFVINSGAYLAGTKYEFYTYPDPYPNLGVPVIAEYSVPITKIDFLDITVTGGL